MKTNEAPEKIYLQKYDIDTILCLNRYNIHEEWTERPICGNSATCNDIEYTRTDAFIEKAISYLNSKLYDWVQTTNPNQRSYANTIMKQDFIKDFRNYIEGE